MRRGLITAACLTVAAALPASAAADLPGRPLAVAAQDAGDIQVFFKDANGNLLESQENAGTWSGPAATPISGLASDPAVANVGSTDYLFWKGTDNALWEATDTAGQWSSAVPLGDGPMASDPTVVHWNDGTYDRLDVFWAGTDNGLWQTFQVLGSSWSAPYEVTTRQLSSAPSVAAVPGEIADYWAGPDGDMDEQFYAGSGWNATDLGDNPVSSPPAATTSGNGNWYLFWRGASSTLWFSTLTGSWSPAAPSNVGPLASAPSAVGIGSAQADVFFEGTDNNLWQATYANGSFTQLQSVGPLTPQPTTQATPQPVTITPVSPTPSGSGTKKKTKPTMHVKVSFKATWKNSRTVLHDLKFSKIPAHSGVRISCSGTRCPHNLGLTTAKLTLATLVKRLESDTFTVGQKLTIKIGHTGYTPESVRVTIRRGAEPALKLL